MLTLQVEREGYGNINESFVALKDGDMLRPWILEGLKSALNANLNGVTQGSEEFKVLSLHSDSDLFVVYHYNGKWFFMQILSDGCVNENSYRDSAKAALEAVMAIILIDNEGMIEELDEGL